LCKILNLPVPDVPFPHANDKDAIQEALIGFIKQALLRWLMMFAAAGVVLALLIWAWSLA
jgi:Sulfotransferase domain